MPEAIPLLYPAARLAKERKFPMLSASRSVVTAIILVASIAAAQAQTQEQDHAAHHPPGQAKEPTPSAPTGMPMPGMPAGQSGGMPMMGGDMGQMMRMMQTMMAQGGMRGSMGMMPLDHIEGRIAFLKAELGITDAQEPQWNAFANALRTEAKSTQGEHMLMMGQRGPASWPDRLALHERLLSDRLAALKALEDPAKSLYAVLSEQQRHNADELMGGPMGMM
jgi:hypothetical protein